MARSEFRFVIDGMDLSEEQSDHISRAIQEAGARALSGLDIDGPTLGIDIGRIGRELLWRGRIVFVDRLAAQALNKIEGTVIGGE